MNVADICTREVVVVDRNSSLQKAAALMREHHVGMLLVTGNASEGMHAVGIVTDRDLVVEAMARGLEAGGTAVGQLADGKLAAVPASAPVDTAIETMKERGVRRLLVTADDGRLYGVVSLDDMLDVLAHDMVELARAVRGGIERETAERPPLRAAPLQGIRMPYPVA